MRRCSGCGESLAGAHPQRRWCAPCRRIRHAEQVVARQRERYRTDPEYRAAKLARARAMRQRAAVHVRCIPRQAWTEADDEAVHRGYADGAPVARIAADVGRTPSTVYTRATGSAPCGCPSLAPPYPSPRRHARCRRRPSRRRHAKRLPPAPRPPHPADGRRLMMRPCGGLRRRRSGSPESRRRSAEPSPPSGCAGGASYGPGISIRRRKQIPLVWGNVSA